MVNQHLCDCSGSVKIDNSVIGCRKCSGNCGSQCQNLINESIQRLIQKQARVSSSQYVNVLGSINIGNDFLMKPNNLVFTNGQNMSDRIKPHIQTRYVSRKRTSHKPGCMGPVGTGVDIKHGSYARYLGKLKTPDLVVSKSKTPPIYGNKTKNLSLINTKCEC